MNEKRIFEQAQAAVFNGAQTLAEIEHSILRHIDESERSLATALIWIAVAHCPSTPPPDRPIKTRRSIKAVEAPPAPEAAESAEPHEKKIEAAADELSTPEKSSEETEISASSSSPEDEAPAAAESDPAVPIAEGDIPNPQDFD